MRLVRRRRRQPVIEITHRQVELPRLPPAFAGLRVVQLSDIHHGLYVPLERVVEAVQLANRLEPDLVALTGDFVSNSVNYIEPVAEALGHLRATLGVFAVLGNHDFRVDAQRITTALEARDIQVLRNSHVCLAREADHLVVAGVDDLRYREDNLRRALYGCVPDALTILLCHHPAILPRAAGYGVDLVLSGHTHGGQVGLPRLRKLAAARGIQLPFGHGWRELNGTQLYISRGLGTVVLPIRLRCPAEIPLLQLYPANGLRRTLT